MRLTLLEAFSTAAEEISAELAPGSVDVRLRGGAAGFVVTPPPAAPVADDAAAGPVEVRLPAAEGDDAAMVRINLRLPANLKALIEDAAAGGGISVNAWIVRAAAAGLASEGRRAARPAPAQQARAGRRRELQRLGPLTSRHPPNRSSTAPPAAKPS